jgi:L-ascorbate metabolism protein UlaG (beta-lactamase superfamily)
MNLPRHFLCVALVALSVGANADDSHEVHAHYLANAGVMVAKGDAKILFDPFFRNDYGVYDLVPPDLEAAVFAGSAPWDDVDAVFISHHHDDHFDPALVVAYLQKWPLVELYGPQQAVDALINSTAEADQQLLNRVHGLGEDDGGDSMEIKAHGMVIEAVQIPHAGWPSRHTAVHNIAFRVTLDSDTTVVHLGDADKGREHYEPHREYWQARTPLLAFAPVWLLLTDPGRFVLEEFVNADHTIGIHVFSRVPDDPDDRPPEFEGLDIFTQPGEIRDIE